MLFEAAVLVLLSTGFMTYCILLPFKTELQKPRDQLAIEWPFYQKGCDDEAETVWKMWMQLDLPSVYQNSKNLQQSMWWACLMFQCWWYTSLHAWNELEQKWTWMTWDGNNYRKAEFLAASKATFWPTPVAKERTFHSSGFKATGS